MRCRVFFIIANIYSPQSCIKPHYLNNMKIKIFVSISNNRTCYKKYIVYLIFNRAIKRALILNNVKIKIIVLIPNNRTCYRIYIVYLIFNRVATQKLGSNIMFTII